MPSVIENIAFEPRGLDHPLRAARANHYLRRVRVRTRSPAAAATTPVSSHKLPAAAARSPVGGKRTGGNWPPGGAAGGCAGGAPGAGERLVGERLVVAPRPVVLEADRW